MKKTKKFKPGKSWEQTLNLLDKVEKLEGSAYDGGYDDYIELPKEEKIKKGMEVLGIEELDIDGKKRYQKAIDGLASLPISTFNKERDNKWKLFREIRKWTSPDWYDDEEHNNEINSFTIVVLKEKFNLDDKTASKVIERLIQEKRIKILDKEKDIYLKIKTCSRCGKIFDRWDIQEDCKIDHHFGYGSKFDLERFKVDLCIDCYDTLIETVMPLFKETPLVEEDIFENVICNKQEQEEDPF